MKKINEHPILEVPVRETIKILFNGKEVEAEKGFTIAAALHRAGYTIHSHSHDDRPRSLECGIGKCGACEMLVDGTIRRICITKVDGVKEVAEIPKNYRPPVSLPKTEDAVKIYKTDVTIIGAGPAGLAARELLIQHNMSTIVVDNNEEIGGQFLMQTHQFFFFEKEKKYGGLRGFDIARTLAGDDHTGIFLNSTVWDIFEGKRVAVKNIKTEEIYYIDSEYVIIATGAVPFIPAFENDDVPGVYTAAVVQKMMNTEFTLLGKRVLTVGAGNIGYLTSYQLMQAGANVKAIVEAQDREGGFPVQANRVRRLGIPVLTSHILMKAIPNEDNTGITGAVVAECKDFKAIPGTEKIIDGIDIINICTGLVPDDQLLIKGNEVFGRHCFGVGDAIRIGEGTSAVLRGKQAAYEIMDMAGVRYNYNDFLSISKEYIDSQQHPVKIIESPELPTTARREKPFVIIDCLYGFACNPCAFACKYGAITKTSTSAVPVVDYDKCIGCMDCVYQCPGLAIFGYHPEKNRLFLPIEYKAQEGEEVFLVNNQGEKVGEGTLEKILKKQNKTNIARVQVTRLDVADITEARGFIVREKYPEKFEFKPNSEDIESKTYVCHCEDVTLDDVLEEIGDRRFISADEVKHITRLGMGACRGKRCMRRLKMSLRSRDINILGEPTPRGPLSNQLLMGELYPKKVHEKVITQIVGKETRKIQTGYIIAGGGIGGSALFRYMSEAGLNPIMINYGRGASWRNIAGGRPNFTVPEISDIARHNLQIFKELQQIKDIDYKPIRYVTFAHDEATFKALDASRAWSDAYMVAPGNFANEISPWMNPELNTYISALITRDCWQATPGKVIDLIRKIGLSKGGTILEDCQLVDVEKTGSKFKVTVKTHDKVYVEYEADHFINALGPEAEKFASKLGIETGLFPVRHQAFITRPLPYMGINGDTLDMLIDRRKYKGFSAVYGQQLADTGQIIGCASPAIDAMDTDKNLKVNTREFTEIVSEIFVDWLPQLSSVGFQAIWSGYYVEPRYTIDPELGLFVGLRGHGFMLSQYLAKLYTDKITGKETPAYFERLKLSGDGLPETSFK
ncbi:MAG: ferredoxin [Bacteroidetes bacterium HGW-Bacteroidetes-21]|nr:MAG: ferredoxin [Bacteroidetes bacterium HGW-Bacteroidetes-21]